MTKLHSTARHTDSIKDRTSTSGVYEKPIDYMVKGPVSRAGIECGVGYFWPPSQCRCAGNASLDS